MKISFLLFAALAGAPSLLAQEATPPLVPDVPRSQTILDTIVNAGPVMIPLFLLSIFSVALVIVYLMTIRRGAVVSSGYMATADALLRKRDYLGLLAVQIGMGKRSRGSCKKSSILQPRIRMRISSSSAKLPRRRDRESRRV